MSGQFADDVKSWYAISCPVSALRFDRRTLEFLDSDRDGHIRTNEVAAALEFLKSKGVDPDGLAADARSDELRSRLEKTLSDIADLSKLEPGDADKKALADWQARFSEPEIAVLGENTAQAEAALAAVEKTIDGFFTPADDMPLVTENPDPELPLDSHLNPRYADAIGDFALKCVRPILSPDMKTLSRGDWKRIKKAFQPYRDWISAKPVMNAGALDRLEEEEKFLRYRLHLGEFLDNFVGMGRLYDGSGAMFQMGVLRIDAREMKLCFHVESEAAHSALAGKSECCVIYLKLTRPAEKAQRSICAVVTAGRVGSLYVGRNGVFYDRDGKDWEATITKVVESQVSLAEAFWAPWKKLGESVSEIVRKFLGDRQSVAEKKLSAQELSKKGAEGGAAMASSVAAIGIGVGMMGAAAASIMAVVSTMSWQRMVLAVVVAVLALSLPSVALTYFKLRRRDLGAILNASGWAINRQMRFSMPLARKFTVVAKPCRCAVALAYLAAAAAAAALVALALSPSQCPAPSSCAGAGTPETQSQSQEVK